MRFIINKLINNIYDNNLGYWRENNESTKLYECLPTLSVCLANKSIPSEICDPKYNGPLCQSCNKNYAKYGTKECRPCYPNNINYFLFCALLLFLTIILAIFIKYNFFNKYL